MNARTIVLDIAELVLEIPAPKSERREDAPTRRAPRRSEDRLVPDKGPTDDLVPDSWGGMDLV